MEIKEFYQKQISLSEWFENLNYKSKAQFRNEDNEKRERLRFLKNTIDLPFDQPVQFTALDLSKNTKKFQKYFKKHSEEFCALRLIPTDSNLTKLRMRGLTVKNTYEWFKEQDINPECYRADFIPHSEKQIWSTIFVVNKNGIFGEIVRGIHHQLTQGFFEDKKPIVFSYNFKDLRLSQKDPDAVREIRKILDYIFVSDRKKQKIINKNLGAKFINNYLEGYFETVSTEEFGLWFIDYNRILGKIYDDFSLNLKSKKTISTSSVIAKGRTACPGIVKGVARLISSENVFKSVLKKGEVLVCSMTTPDYIVHIKNAAAIVTDEGGILCHAAIIAREFKIPCVVATNSATKKINDGDLIEVDANRAEIKLLEKAGRSGEK